MWYVNQLKLFLSLYIFPVQVSFPLSCAHMSIVIFMANFLFAPHKMRQMRRAVCNTMPNKFSEPHPRTHPGFRACVWMCVCHKCDIYDARPDKESESLPAAAGALCSSREGKLGSERTRMDGQGKNIYSWEKERSLCWLR